MIEFKRAVAGRAVTGSTDYFNSAVGLIYFTKIPILSHAIKLPVISACHSKEITVKVCDFSYCGIFNVDCVKRTESLLSSRTQIARHKIHRACGIIVGDSIRLVLNTGDASYFLRCGLRVEIKTVQLIRS